MKTLKILGVLCVVLLLSSCKQDDWLDWKTQNELWLAENAKRAGVAHMIHFQQRPVAALSHPKKYGFVIMMYIQASDHVFS